MRRVFLVLLVVCWAEVGRCGVLLRAEGVEVEVLPERAWTVGQICRHGRAICEPSGSGQGTVLGIDPSQNLYAGSVHGLERLVALRLTVDGRAVEPVDGGEFEGRTIELYRRTILGERYVLHATLRMAGGRIEEQVELQGIDPAATILPAYPFLASRANRLACYAAFDGRGELRCGGTSCSDDNSTVVLSGAVAVAQYDPEQGDGVLSILVEGAGYDIVHFIWDRPFDNKLYVRLREAEADCGAERFYRLRQALVFFDAEPQEWVDVAARKMPAPAVPLGVSADLNGDGRVDGGDLAILAKQWME